MFPNLPVVALWVRGVWPGGVVVVGRCTEEVTRRGGICVYTTIDTVSHADTVILYHTDTLIL